MAHAASGGDEEGGALWRLGERLAALWHGLAEPAEPAPRGGPPGSPGGSAGDEFQSAASSAAEEAPRRADFGLPPAAAPPAPRREPAAPELAPPPRTAAGKPARPADADSEMDAEEMDKAEELLRRRRHRRLAKPKFLCWTVGSKGIATGLFTAVFVALLLFFAALFQWAEADAEIARNIEFVDLMRRVKKQLDPELYAELLDNIGADDVRGTEKFVAFSNGGWDSFTAQSYFSSYYYSFTLATTIGYGEIVTYTPAGKILTMICILIALPFAVITYTRVADLLSSMTMKLLLKQSQEFKAVLNKYDTDQSGTLDQDELKMGFKDLGMPLSDEDIKALLEEFDEDGNGVLDVDEFATVATRLDVDAGKVARRALKLRFAIAVTLVFLVIFAIIAAYILAIDGLDAVYFTVVTLTTVGLGDITPTPVARAPLTIPIFIALGLVALVIGSLTERIEMGKEDHEESDEGEESEESENSPPPKTIGTPRDSDQEIAPRSSQSIDLEAA